jgi:hypothetical protein
MAIARIGLDPALGATASRAPRARQALDWS